MHATMASKEYYRKNREARLKYQRDYYKANKGRIARKREVAEAVNPKLKEKRKEYQRAYYRKNRARILKMRAEDYARKKSANPK
tara:strand:- start:6268 stop:6519 length:252 start_codon:yes stop_codon:yes gene_type:complete